MAFVRQTELFFVVAALAGVGWTMSASELWVAAQRAMPGWARGRMPVKSPLVASFCADSVRDLRVARSSASTFEPPTANGG
jgi:hypothetical protein